MRNFSQNNAKLREKINYIWENQAIFFGDPRKYHNFLIFPQNFPRFKKFCTSGARAARHFLQVCLEYEAKTNISGFVQFAQNLNCMKRKIFEMRRKGPITLFCDVAVRNNIGPLGEIISSHFLHGEFSSNLNVRKS